MSPSRREVMIHPILLAVGVPSFGRAPTFNIFGSFFPSWLLCLFAGIVIAAAGNRLILRFEVGSEILWPLLTYPCLALLIACILWLVFFS